MHEHHQHQKTPALTRWYRIGTVGAISIMLFYLLSEHTVHVISFLPYFLLALCPLMHFFMHGKGHGHEHNPETKKEKV